jgi:hypothetical protein
MALVLKSETEAAQHQAVSVWARLWRPHPIVRARQQRSVGISAVGLETASPWVETCGTEEPNVAFLEASQR